MYYSPQQKETLKEQVARIKKQYNFNKPFYHYGKKLQQSTN